MNTLVAADVGVSDEEVVPREAEMDSGAVEPQRHEEFFDLANDPDCLVNLVGDPRYQEQAEEYRGKAGVQMRETEDPLAPAFALRHDPKRMDDLMWETYAPWRGRKGTNDDQEDQANNRKKNWKRTMRA